MAKKSRTKKQKTPSQVQVEKQPAPKPKSQLVTYFIIFVMGFICGVGFTVYKSDGIGGGSSAPAVVQQNQAPDNESSQAILNLEATVTAKPDDQEAWTRLGHLYFDTNQVEKAIGAYTKSLELKPNDANVLTDLGVMYRRAKQPQKALESFDKARALDANHLPSRFNKGIVLFYDLSDPGAAIESWEELLKIDPEAKTSSGQPLRDLINQIKADMKPEAVKQ